MRRQSLSLRVRIVIAMVALTISTALALSYVTRSFLDRSLSLGVNKEVGRALDDAMRLARSSYNERRETLRGLGARLSASPEAFQAFQSGDLPRLRRFIAEEGGEMHILEVIPTPLHGPSPSPGALSDLGAPLKQQDVAEAVRSGPYLYRDEHHRDILRMIVPFKEGDRLSGVLTIGARIDSTYFRIEQADQTYQEIDNVEQAFRRSFLHAFLAVALAVLLVAVLVGVWIAFGITHPLRNLIRGTQELARDNLSHRIPKRRNDEIGILIDSFNRMASDLQENRRQRVEAEKVAAWREIARKLAHEIKNPLTPIQLTVQQLRDKYTGNDPAYRKLVTDCADIVTDEVESLKSLVRVFADFARLPDLSRVPTDLNTLIEDVGKLYPDAPLTFSLADGLPLVPVDPAQMRRVLINLIKNAEDAIGEAGRIIIRTGIVDRQEKGDPASASDSEAQGWVEVEVSDTGDGIPSEHLDHVFEPYFSTKRSGMGLGLTIVKNIVEQHGGRIRVQSRAGAGTSFKVWIPSARRPAEEPPAPDAANLSTVHPRPQGLRLAIRDLAGLNGQSTL